MGFRVMGMASGLPPNLVDQLIEAERIPIKQMEQKKAKDEEKLKLLNELTEKINKIPKSVEDLVHIRGFKNTKFHTGDEKIVTGVADPEKASPGQWQIEVLQLAKKPGVKTNSFPDKDSTLAGAGYLRFKTNDGTKTIYISRNESTLEGIAQAINRANIGLFAQVVEDNQSSREKYSLIISGTQTGKDQHVEFPQVYLIDGEEDLFFHQEVPGQNAKIKLDGLEFELQHNEVTDLIPGVTLELKQAAPGNPIVIKIKEDFEVIGNKMKEFVDAYNEALSWIQNQAKLQKDKSGRERLGPFGGDSLIRSTENRLRQAILQPQTLTQSSIQRLSELGIEFNRNGTLNFNQDKFNKVLRAKPQDVVKFLRGDQLSYGFIPTVRQAISSLTNSTYGPLNNRT
ncbi:MAG: flagellar filament capping protein FliD, partial [Bdellovibrionaceae bacterium]|nr:flagellar filament capping protein FliD [Pseudobdellovibrionaceae bacterium]MDW8191034.1 flagellar filament capping protein FliD [Pseudobdellovibrionaceae bacterium]